MKLMTIFMVKFKRDLDKLRERCRTNGKCACVSTKKSTPWKFKDNINCCVDLHSIPKNYP